MSRLGHLAFAIAALTALTALTALAPQPASAQQIYRSVGPDGKVTFSDHPPAANANPVNPSERVREAAPNAAPNAGGNLPYALQQVVNRFPVTLYTARDCPSCNAARNLLVSRGVPFTERTIENNESISALEAISGSATIPFGTIGGQRMNGFSDVQWTQYLDAAGYPKTSQLPSNYRRAAPTPLATATTPAAGANAQTPAARESQAPAAPRDTTAPTGPTPSNPAGIVF
ncbi:glutaredoxin domain-containing protein [Diaphorobacter sp.]|uniref:glutaredoxin domain-containing protein n=1 Tax=Diaphorobacter sp. TaxID=1934310 RepID=UPI0028AC9501|nr:glutaredoxin domain-containing protein [Diaphorobacter sp.]